MLIDDVVGRRVLVVGDVMLDRFVSGVVERVSPEAPALVVRVEDEREMLGGAANVAANVSALGGRAVLVGVIGDDAAGAAVAKRLAACDTVEDAMVRVPSRPTTCKTRYLGGDRHLLRADREAIGLDAGAVRAVIAEALAALPACHAVVISDYAKGVACADVVREVIAAARAANVPVAVDPKSADLGLYAGARLITPNRREMRLATGEVCDDASSCDRAGAAALEATSGAAVLLTLSEAGVALYRPAESPWREGSRARAVRDVSGAGDTVIAAAALALAAGAGDEDAARFANAAAAVAVGKSGTAVVTPSELNLALLHGPDAEDAEKLVPLASAAEVVGEWRREGLKVGLTNGCFDLLHPGHVKLLAAARRLCDRLVVALNTDASIARLKGPDRPVQTELARAEVIGAMRPVDLMVLFDEDTPLAVIEALRPDVLVKGADYTVETVVGADLVLGWGGRVELIELAPGQSSSRLIDRSRQTRSNPEVAKA